MEKYTLYLSKYVEKFPIRQDINVLHTDAPVDFKLNCVVYEYIGCEVLNKNKKSFT